MTVTKMLYFQFYILLQVSAHVDSADAVLYCVELFSLMLVLLYERALALIESHCITFIVLSFFLSSLSTFHGCYFCYNSNLFYLC